MCDFEYYVSDIKLDRRRRFSRLVFSKSGTLDESMTILFFLTRFWSVDLISLASLGWRIIFIESLIQFILLSGIGSIPAISLRAAIWVIHSEQNDRGHRHLPKPGHSLRNRCC
ncbi:Uncharacterized protein FWK35_00033350 [Aphis craccivora]|uniref:Uncharacterized protein n=1 Tax=Aphis craccivora TaxID=307492 RepID=A0A6G0YU46_APHCR|nr:Uncharacterized protein FWK35_00033350 [Aphis craccivora]